MRGPVSDLRQVSQRADSNTRTSGPEGLECDPGLEFEQVALERDAAAEADHLAAGADDAVARDDDRDRVPVTGDTDGSGRSGITDDSRDFAVRLHLAVRDLSQLGPDGALEVRAAADRQRHGELLEFAGEVRLQLLLGLGQQRVWLEVLVDPAEVQSAQPGAVHSQGQVADGRIDHGPAHGAILAPGTDSFWRLCDRQECADDVLFSLGHSVLCYL